MGINHNKIPAFHKKWVGGIMCLYLSLNERAVDKRLSFHMARHTNATLLLYNGANITTVQKLLGHKSVRTTEIYSDIMDMTVIRDLENITLK